MPLNTQDISVRAYICAHALLRGQQRGIRQPDIEVVFNHGDREEPARSGCYRLSISSRQMMWLLERGIIAPAQAERCKRLTIVTDGCRVITNYRSSRLH